jgi:glutamyl-Q tRNA(Asp) synthetase
LEKLELDNSVFHCACSRKQLSEKPYPGTCRKGIKAGEIARSIRIKTNNEETRIIDQLQGLYAQHLESDVGDFIVKRADGFFAYHLVVVVDDADQEITDVVRGFDLLYSTPRQVYLQKKLNIQSPSYLHLPIAIDCDGKKISKATNAEAISFNNPKQTLFSALKFLGQNPPKDILELDIESLLNWSISNWDVNTIPKQKEIEVLYP